MATVPHSGRITQALKEAATAPFTKIISETTRAIKEDELLMHYMRLGYSGPEQTALAEKLTAMNSKWTSNWHGAVCVYYKDQVFQLNINDQPFAIHRGGSCTLNIDAGFTPEFRPAVDRFLFLHAPLERAQKDKAEIEKAIDAVVEATPNLQRACEVMPSISNWMPDDVRLRYNAPRPEKAPKRKTAEEIKADTLTPEALAALARSRMI